MFIINCAVFYRKESSKFSKNSQKVPDLSLEAGQGCLVDAVLGNEQLVLQGDGEVSEVHLPIQAEVQGLHQHTHTHTPYLKSRETDQCRPFL